MAAWQLLAIIMAAALLCSFLAISAGGWYAFKWLSRQLETSMGKFPKNTVWEWIFSLSSTSLREIELIEQRAQNGAVATHPMGSPKHHHWLDELAWNDATLDPYARPSSAKGLEVRLGPRAQRPLPLSLPILPAPMAWGLSLNAAAKIALAEATTLVGSAANSGEGPFLWSERAAAAQWILQASRGAWAHQAHTVQLADMVEIQLGQASEGGGAVKRKRTSLPRKVRKALDGHAYMIIHSGKVRPLAGWIREIRRLNPAIPVGVKIPATNHVEHDVVRLVLLGVDVITLDGSEAGTAQSPAVIHDYAGIPTSVAVRRADRVLRQLGLRHRVSLVASGGLRGAADIAKVLALGADVAVLGTSLLLAASHKQISPVLPGKPPTSPMFANGKAPFNSEMGAEHLVNWFRSTRQELEEIIGVLGLTAFSQLGPEHLVAHSQEAAWLLSLSPLTGGWDLVNVMIEELTLSYAHWAGIFSDLLGDWPPLTSASAAPPQ